MSLFHCDFQAIFSVKLRKRNGTCLKTADVVHCPTEPGAGPMSTSSHFISLRPRAGQDMSPPDKLLCRVLLLFI